MRRFLCFTDMLCGVWEIPEEQDMKKDFDTQKYMLKINEQFPELIYAMVGTLGLRRMRQLFIDALAAKSDQKRWNARIKKENG
jgi:hypothetical protein